MLGGERDRDDLAIQTQQFRRVLMYGAGVMVLFCLISYLQIAEAATFINLVSAAADTTLLGILVVMRWLLRRVPLGAAATTISIAILVYGVINLVLFPGGLLRMIAGPLLAVMVALSYVGTRTLRWLSVAAWVAVAAQFMLAVRQVPSEEQLIDLTALMGTTAIILLILHQFHGRINAALRDSRGANVALRSAQGDLEAQVAARTEELQQALAALQGRADDLARLLAETEEQRSTIRAMSVPVLPVGDRVLAIPLVGSFDQERLAIVQQETLAAVEQTRAAWVVIDLTGVTLVDSAVATGVVQIAQMSGLIGARTILTGIRPEVAQSLVGLQADLSRLRVAATLQEGVGQALRAG
jgi:rsbT co-antagonist protein RsbR